MSSAKVIQVPRGCKDILPDEQKYWFWLEKNFQDVVHAAGFERIILPTFEDTELFKRSVGEFTDIVTKHKVLIQQLLGLAQIRFFQTGCLKKIGQGGSGGMQKFGLLFGS